MRIAIIGIGRLGRIFADALSRHHELILIDRDFGNALDVASRLGAQPIKDLHEAESCDMAIVAVKPAHAEEVVRQIAKSPLIISCAAGVPIARLESWGAQKVIRIMPNICVDVNEALIAYSLHPEVERKERLFLAAFSSLGLCLKADESHLDAITAISGSGPAFLAYFAKAMMDEAAAIGLSPETAQICVAQTFLGTGKLMLGGWSPEKIIATAASPGGATEEGLKALIKKGAGKPLGGAIRLAARKAGKLGK